MVRWDTVLSQRWLRNWWVGILLAAVASSFALFMVQQHSAAMSPVDEWVYIDYLEKVPSEGIVKRGEAIGQRSLERMACNGVYPYGPMGAPCGGPYEDLTVFPQGAGQSAEIYTPLYFWVTRALGEPLRAVGADDLTAWRATGALWLAATVLVLWGLLAAWRVPQLARVATIAALVASPYAFWTFTYVSTDAASVVSGAALLWAATLVARGRGRVWILLVLGVVAVWFKVQNILGVGLAVAYLLLTWLLPRLVRPPLEPERDRTGRLPLVAVVLAGSALGAQVLWLVIRRLMAHGGSVDQGVGSELTTNELVRLSVDFLNSSLSANVVVSPSGQYALPLTDEPYSWVVALGVFGVVAMLRSVRDEVAPLGITVLVMSLLSGPALALGLLVVNGSYFPMPPRYAAPLLGGILLTVGLMLRSRLIQALVLGWAVVMAFHIGSLSLTVGV